MRRIEHRTACWLPGTACEWTLPLRHTRRRGKTALDLGYAAVHRCCLYERLKRRFAGRSIAY